MGYEYLDIYGDAGVRATGRSLGELFTNTALGMYGLITDPGRVAEKLTIHADATSNDVGGLLVVWLNELIFRFDTHGFVGRKVKVLDIREDKISAEVSGEEFDPERHERRLLLKAATYHDLKVEKKDGEWSAEVIFDI